MTRRPNFFIVGAPKCGTTALSEYLRTHPNVFMSTPKEPHYFATDFSRQVYHYTQSLEDYVGLFREATVDHRAVGEASVWYLYSSVALRNIQTFAPDARIIAMVRNPIDMAHSLHAQLLLRFEEDENDFKRAWELQGVRSAGYHIPGTNAVPAFLQYRAVCSLGSQLERLLATFPREQVHVVVFDDFASATRDEYDKVLTFLGIRSDGRTEFPTVNPRAEHASRRLARIDYEIRRLARYRGLGRAVQRVKRALGIDGRVLELSSFRRQSELPRKPMSSALRAELATTFQEEIALLGHLLARDLDHWLQPPATS